MDLPERISPGGKLKLFPQRLQHRPVGWLRPQALDGVDSFKPSQEDHGPENIGLSHQETHQTKQDRGEIAGQGGGFVAESRQVVQKGSHDSDRG